ncbi:hypothetical protein BU113_14415, partial [Staphylococcus shinii]
VSCIILFFEIFYVSFVLQATLAIVSYIFKSNWKCIIISFIIIPVSLYIDHHYINKDTNTSL